MKGRKMSPRPKKQVVAQEVKTNLGNVSTPATSIDKNSSQGNNQLLWWQQLLPPTLLTLLTALFYWPSLRYPFQFDDVANITKKFAIRYDNPFERWWRNSRWLGDWLNRVNYQFGHFDSIYYRSVNLLIHIITGLLVFYVIRSLCRCLVNKPFFHKNASLLAFATAGLFLLHPIQTQTVSYVIQARVEGLASLFAVLLVFFFVQFALAKNRIIRWMCLGVMFFLSLPAWGTKEIVVVVPFLLFLVDWFFISQEQWSVLKNRLWVHLAFDLYFFALMLHYLTLKFPVDVASMNIVLTNNRGNILTEHAYDLITPYRFLISEFRVVLHYLWMFIWPFSASVEYDWRLSNGFFSAASFFPFLTLVSLYGSAFYAAFKKKYAFFTFGLFWFLICVAPRSSIIPSSELVCDYKTYLASIGWVFILASCIVWLLVKVFDFFATIISTTSEVGMSKMVTELFRREVQICILSLVFIPVGIFSLMRNKVWETEINFWADSVQKAPLKARVHNNYGVALNEAGRIDESIEAYKKAIALDKHYSDPLSNIAVAYCLKNELDKAIESLKGALNINPDYPEAYNNLGSLYIKKQQYDDAERMLQKAVALRPYYGKAYYNLGRLYLDKKDEVVAWNYFKKATEGDLDNPDGFFTFGQMSMRLKKYEEAAHAFEQVIERGCSTDQIWFNLANANFMLARYDKAEPIYVKLVRDNPLEPKYIYNLAETYFIKKEYSKASELFKKITGLPQPLPQAFLRVAACLEKMNLYKEARGYLNDLLKINAPDEFKKVVQNELMRINLQEKIKQGNGSIKLNDLKQAFAMHSQKNKVIRTKKL